MKLVSVKVELTKLCFSHSCLPGATWDKSPDFSQGTKGMGFVYDTIFANAGFWSCAVQMYRLCTTICIYSFCGIKLFCFPSVRFLFIPLVLDKMHVRYDHTDDDTDTE